MIDIFPVISEWISIRKKKKKNNWLNKGNCLATVCPDVAKEWHPTKNGDLTPYDVTYGSHEKIWWRCVKGHDYPAYIYRRSNGDGCSFCSGHRVCKDNCLATLNPKLSKEWHPILNGKLTPKDVTEKSNKTIYWLCSKGHSWPITPRARSKGDGCPYCSGKYACEENCLATLRPDIAKEWHPILNKGLTPKDVTVYSGRKFWWRCSRGHSWDSTIGNRTRRGDGCSFCSGHRVCKDNCLATLNPKLSKEWHPTLNEKLTPKDVTLGSNKKVWWKCSKGHKWKTAVANRTSQGAGCSVCSKGMGEREAGKLLKRYFKGWKIISHKKIWREYKKYNSKRYCDFWLEKDSVYIIVEYDGIQHFQPTRFNGIPLKQAQKLFERQQKIDKLDAMFCKEHGIILYRIRYDDDKEESIKKLIKNLK